MSKGDLRGGIEEGRRDGRPMAATPTTLPEPLLGWACMLVPDDRLGHDLRVHLAGKGEPMLGYNMV